MLRSSASSATHRALLAAAAISRSIASRTRMPTAATAAYFSSSTGNNNNNKDKNSNNNTKNNNPTPRRPDDVIIPGTHNRYGSLHDAGRRNNNRFNDGLPNNTGGRAAWQASDHADVQHVTLKAMVYELIHQQTKTIEATVPWFLSNMPASYFQQVPENFRMDHIKAIAAVKDANMDLYLNLQSHLSDGRQVLTFIRPGTEAGTLLQMVKELPDKFSSETPLSRLHVFSTADNSMSLDMFVFGKPAKGQLSEETVRDIGAPILERAIEVQSGQAGGDLDPNPLFDEARLVQYMTKCTETYLLIGSENPSRFLRQVTLVDAVSGSEGTAVNISEETREPGHYWVDMAVSNSLPQVVLENMCRLVFVHNFDVTRARLDIIPTNDGSNVTMLRTLVSPVPGTQATIEAFDLLGHELKRAKWLDPQTYEIVFDKFPELGVTRAEIITGLCAAMHPVLAKVNALAFSNTSIYQKVSHPRFIGFAAQIADLFLDRFRPTSPLSDAEFQARCDGIKATIETDVEDSMANTVLLKMIDMVKHTLKTNVYMPDRYALSLRLDPACMVPPYGEPRDLPYGILFVHGRRFNGFHVRFRDIARGGMRLVTPASAEQYALESARQYDECYGLAFAQQLKNKDIPEGGSKAVNLINTEGLSEKSKNFVMRKSVKAFTDAMLDLIVDTEYTRKYLVDLWGRKEVLYLGPDEQVIPEDIEWIVRRAAARGYETPAAFMSSKPKAGINHKEYGVTSEGVNVYLDVALRQVLGIDPTKDSFSVKISGGPNGDVAGNELKILFREYGDNVKVVGVADHSGCAEDPDGLNHDELLRLFVEELAISHFDKSKLGSSGVMHTVDTLEGLKARNSMHNRLEADAFLPCGGRPNTIDIRNYKQFLKADGKPSAPLIVEGANLFVTDEARKALFDDAGVVIVKDSSANKGGVITSSYEICAAMMLTEEEFVQYKEQIVSEVLEKLRGLAKMEALLLFREVEDYEGISLPEVSQIISNCINVTTDALSAALDELTKEDREELLPLFRAHLPKTMTEIAFDRLHEKVPDQYIKNAISSCLASKMVYKEGTKYIAAQPQRKLAKMALSYIKKEKEVATLMEAINEANLPDSKKKEILKLLEQGGARTAMQLL